MARWEALLDCYPYLFSEGFFLLLQLLIDLPT